MLIPTRPQAEQIDAAHSNFFFERFDVVWPTRASGISTSTIDLSGFAGRSPGVGEFSKSGFGAGFADFPRETLAERPLGTAQADSLDQHRNV